jgi:hypothetical protein
LKPSPLCQDRVKDKANNTAADTKKITKQIEDSIVSE